MAFIQNFNRTDVDTIDEKIGFKLPFTFETINQSTTTISAIKTNLTNLLLTQKGERPFQPNLGVDFNSVLFNPITEEGLVNLEEDIIEQISIWLPFLVVENIVIDSNNIQDNRVNKNALTIEGVLFN